MSTKQAETEQNHAELNARCWVQSLAEMVAKLTREGAARVWVEALKDDELKAEWFEELGVDEMPGTREEVNNLLIEAIAEETLDVDGFEFDEESAREEIQESPLSVQVRSGWYTPGAVGTAEEFEILLSTGGPALRIRGELDAHMQPDRAWLEYQDWGTPWTQYFDVEQDTLLAYCRAFYFGE
jgi:hypothetical protein